MKLSYLTKGFPGHPLHPPLTDATIGIYTAAAALLSMLNATVFFLLAAIFGHGGYVEDEVTGGSLVLTLVGFGFLTLGGWLGGSVVFVHGMRVLNLVEEPARRAVAPVPHSDEEGR